MNDVDFIYQVVDSFYAKAKSDVLIGYQFRNIKDFDEHIPRIAAFWEIILLGGTRRELTEPFDVMKVHVPLNLHPGELGRWLVLFKKTLDEKVAEHPEFKDMKESWLERLGFFEGVFSRYFGFKRL